MSNMGRYLIQLEEQRHVRAQRNSSSRHRNKQSMGHDMDGGSLSSEQWREYCLLLSGGATDSTRGDRHNTGTQSHRVRPADTQEGMVL